MRNVTERFDVKCLKHEIGTNLGVLFEELRSR